MDDSVKQLISEAEVELLCMDQLKPAVLSLPASAIFNVIAQIQLALSHPQNNGPSAELAKSLARQMQLVFSENSSTYKVIDLGWMEGAKIPPSPEDGGVTGTVRIEVPPELEEMHPDLGRQLASLIGEKLNEVSPNIEWDFTQ